MKKNKIVVEVGGGQLFIYWLYLMIAWGLFRLTVKLPDLEEELIIKPLIWGWPLLGWQLFGRLKLKLFEGNTLKAIGEGVLLGLMFALVMVAANWLKAGVVGGERAFAGLNSMEIVTAGLATAIVEEIVFAGFVLSLVSRLIKDEWGSIAMTTILFATLHIPIAVFVYNYIGMQIIGFLAIVALTAAGRYWLMKRSNNLWAPIVTHWMWILTVWAIG